MLKLKLSERSCMSREVEVGGAGDLAKRSVALVQLLVGGRI